MEWASWIACNTGDIGDVCLIPNKEDPLQEEMATCSKYSSPLKTPWTEESSRLRHSMGSQRDRIEQHSTEHLNPRASMYTHGRDCLCSIIIAMV